MSVFKLTVMKSILLKGLMRGLNERFLLNPNLFEPKKMEGLSELRGKLGGLK